MNFTGLELPFIRTDLEVETLKIKLLLHSELGGGVLTRTTSRFVQKGPQVAEKRGSK